MFLNGRVGFLCKVRCPNDNPLFLRFKASAVTPSRWQVGHTRPFPVLKAGLFSSCLPRCASHCSQPIFPQNEWVLVKAQESALNFSNILDIIVRLPYFNKF